MGNKDPKANINVLNHLIYVGKVCTSFYEMWSEMFQQISCFFKCCHFFATSLRVYYLARPCRPIKLIHLPLVCLWNNFYANGITEDRWTNPTQHNCNEHGRAAHLLLRRKTNISNANRTWTCKQTFICANYGDCLTFFNVDFFFFFLSYRIFLLNRNYGTISYRCKLQ